MMIDILEARVYGNVKVDIDPFKSGMPVSLEVEYDAIYKKDEDLCCDESSIWKMVVKRDGKFLDEFSEFLEYNVSVYDLLHIGMTEEDAVTQAIEEAVVQCLDKEEFKEFLKSF